MQLKLKFQCRTKRKDGPLAFLNPQPCQNLPRSISQSDLGFSSIGDEALGFWLSEIEALRSSPLGSVQHGRGEFLNGQLYSKSRSRQLSL